ncbi:SET domain-containing protein [Cytidiella melzeri]|nr:SET domain-containing protein [Cytidiella melzeri]
MSDSASDEEGKRETERWQRLLQWLTTVHDMDVGEESFVVEVRRAKDADRGLFASVSCQPSATLFTIPARAMINVKTLNSLYPAKTVAVLSPTQLVSLHMFLHRPYGNGESCDPTFGPYLSALPRDFSSHPLTWTLSNPGQCPVYDALISSLPRGLGKALRDLRKRFSADWMAVSEHLGTSPATLMTASREDMRDRHVNYTDETLQNDYLWAWLNVNTRCIYYRLSTNQSAPENMTMCPILDFANHAPSNSHILPVMPSSLFTPSSSRKKKSGNMGGDYTFIAYHRPIQKNEQLFLQYGAHSNTKLFVEYGFVNSWAENDCMRGDFVGEVDLQDILEEMFEDRGSTVGAWMRSVLQEEGYWGCSRLSPCIDWTMHSSPTPAHPSYRLIAALRLYHVVPESATSLPEGCEDLLESWKRVLVGRQECISLSNEQAWRETLARICERVRQRAKAGLKQLARNTAALEDRPQWLEWMVGTIQLLWKEEQEVAEAVAVSVRSGEEF